MASRRGLTLHSVANQWPLSFQGGICQSGSSTGPHPTSHQSSYCLIISSTMTIDALFIAGSIQLCFYNLCGYLIRCCCCCCELLRNLFCCVSWCEGMWNPYLYVLGYKFPLCNFWHFSLWCVVGLSEMVATVRMHKNTPCTVFSALNKICCILIWNLHTWPLSVFLSNFLH